MTLTEFFRYVRKRRIYKPGHNIELQRDNTEFARRVRLSYMLWSNGLARAVKEQIEKVKGG